MQQIKILSFVSRLSATFDSFNLFNVASLQTKSPPIPPLSNTRRLSLDQIQSRHTTNHYQTYRDIHLVCTKVVGRIGILRL